MSEHDTIYPCQVSETLSCGACCGLYNLPDISKEKLETLLAKRTREFASVPRTEEAIYGFQRTHRGPHRLSRPFAQFHHCPFLGLVGERKGRVGCLLHPETAGNNNTDYRSLSWYGEQACRSYFCPSTIKLPPVYLAILLQAIPHWYDFGLIVTEHALVTAYFKEIESRIGRQVTVDDYRRNREAKAACQEFAGLKSIWPHRRDDSSGPCNFFFENGLYLRKDVLRTAADIPLSAYEDILKELESGFASRQELASAEHLLDDLFAKAERSIMPACHF